VPTQPARHHCTSECVTWIGTQKCHCSRCGETFTNVSNFDKHWPKGQHIQPIEAGLEQRTNGIWSEPGEVDFNDVFRRN